MGSLIYSRDVLKVVIVCVYLSSYALMLILQRTKEELDALMIGDEEEVIEVDNPRKIYLKAVMLMLGGAIMTGVLADPLVEAVEKISDATTIPSFFISFIIMPFATTSSELFSAIPDARRKKVRTASLTYSEVLSSYLCIFHLFVTSKFPSIIY